MKRNKFLDFLGGLIGVIILLAIIAVILYFMVEPFAIWVDENIIINRTSIPHEDYTLFSYLKIII